MFTLKVGPGSGSATDHVLDPIPTGLIWGAPGGVPASVRDPPGIRRRLFMLGFDDPVQYSLQL